MTSTELERHTGNSAAITDEHYLNRLPALAEQFAKSSMCPEHFRGKPADIEITAWGLAENGIRLNPLTLKQCFVIKGSPGYGAQLQSTMAALHGIDIHPIDTRCTADSATVEVVMPNGARYEVTFTMEEARTAKLDKNPGEMYLKWPGNMLVARATTRAIDRHCPAVKLGLAGSINMADLHSIEAESHDIDPETGEISPPASSPGEPEITVPAGMKLVLAAVTAAHPDWTESQCKGVASLLWSSHQFPRGQQMMPLSLVEAAISRLSPVPDQGVPGDEPVASVITTAQEPETVQPEIVPAGEPGAGTGQRLDAQAEQPTLDGTEPF